ncbi:putative bifunctional diguanylate cyclase/phosphodiesterase [Marinomonas ostreistagni]|uniref:Bifunctional diguanylate cyclase/phosphodiesterase n=1 Tax=Marinomonas ostreistagni TaxID=359209 RepID=A0ABS0Z8D0_9GAMM|nr:bifunctional diguanylate cyclase/phosphodiesterase [Marinomonas ostreistagni]MBJ7549913.1 bifunctional diguanylate cyclase/phosphodiesterase [Marinomonas ostreistagni]
MTTLFELQLDKSLRRKLIFICLLVAIVISAIYSVIAYRLSSELGVDTEIRFLEKRALFLMAEIEEEGDDAEERVAELISLMQTTEHQPEELYLIFQDNEGTSWELNQFMPKKTVSDVLQQIGTAYSADNKSGFNRVDGHYHIWTVQNQPDKTLTLVISSHSLDQARAHIFKRLIISSVIVFWIAVWLALTLSSWIAKRVEDKNEALKKLATHDNLTGLPNRLFLADLFERYQRKHNAPEKGALFLINIDKFKDINETLGHRNGDKLLIVFAHRIEHFLSKDQVVIRTSADEFLVWVPEVDAENACHFADQLIATLTSAFQIDQLPIQLSITIGIALSPNHSDEIDSLMMFADIAMNEARKQRSAWSVFDETQQIEQNSQKTLRYRSELTDALREHQFKLYYQPKVDLQTGRIISTEALARWHHPEDGVVPPIMFISIIEQSGKIREFGRYVIKTSIRQLSFWKSKGIAVPIAVNLSPYNLLDPDIVTFTQDLLKKYDIEPKLLEIELTETATSLHLQTISKSLNAFKEIGVQLSIDDFGTGMSSLAYISSLHVDTIKIDRAFVRDMDENERHLSIVQTALNLAKAFDCTVVAEGVENVTQANLLAALGCHYGQGYYYSRPIPEEQFTAMLQFSPTLPVAST